MIGLRRSTAKLFFRLLLAQILVANDESRKHEGEHVQTVHGTKTPQKIQSGMPST